MSYNHTEIEQKWKERWSQAQLYKTPENGTDKYYCLDMFPYPSGAGLHVGHVEGYTATDIVSRFMRMQGKDVLHPMGWDAFGLPAENYAIKTGVAPRTTTTKAIETFKSQIDNLGLSYDWDREIGTHDPDYYKWTQWLFLQLYKHGLAYRKNAPVNWCPTDQTVLANEQVIDGKCERCDTEVVQRDMEQWFFKITDYADRLIDDLDKIDWPESTKLGQVNWIGRSEGALVKFQINQIDEPLEIFTTRVDTIFGATFLVIAPENKLVQIIKQVATNVAEIDSYIKQAETKTELERQQQKEKTGVRVEGVSVINPINGLEIPLFIADYVLNTYGTGAIMAVPAHDERDFEFAQKYDLEIQVVVAPKDNEQAETTGPVPGDYAPFTGYGVVINSGQYSGMTSEQAKKQIVTDLGDKAQAKVNYRLRDWLAVRQRYWGAPTPMVYDPQGNPHPVDEADLPILLPEDVDFKPTGTSPLTDSVSFHQSAELKYGKGWRREVDTLDTFVDSSWYFFRFADPHNTDAFASKEAMQKWAPVDLYVGGAEHTVLHLLYARFFTKFLFDQGYINFDEPFKKLRHPGTILAEDGRKMSKRWGNVINPDDEIAQFGADTVRMYEMFMGPLKDSKPWSTRTEQGVARFLTKLWNLQGKVKPAVNSTEQNKWINRLIKFAGEGIENMTFNTVVSKYMEFTNFLSKEEQIDSDVWNKFLLTMAPFAPFMTEELWERAGHTTSIHLASWPEFDPAQTIDDTITIGIQVNGKVRADISLAKNAPEAEVKAQVLAMESITKWVNSQEVKKFIYVPGKIISIVV